MDPRPQETASKGLRPANGGRKDVSERVTVLEKACRKTPHCRIHGNVKEADTAKSKPGCPPAGPEGGQAIAEFAFAFPLQLFVMFAIMQLALLYVGKQVVSYASFSAARAALVGEDPADAYRRAETAAALACAPITGPTVEGSNFSLAALTADSAIITLPGWGPVPKSGISRRLKTAVSRIEYPSDGEVEVSVTHYYELTLPGVNYLFAWLADLGGQTPAPDATGPGGTTPRGYEAEFEDSVGIWNVRAPHMRLRETTRLAVPGGGIKAD